MLHKCNQSCITQFRKHCPVKFISVGIERNVAVRKAPFINATFSLRVLSNNGSLYKFREILFSYLINANSFTICKNNDSSMRKLLMDLEDAFTGQ